VDGNEPRCRSSTAPVVEDGVEDGVEVFNGISRLSFVKRDASFGFWAEVMLGHTAVEVGVFKHVLVEEAIDVVVYAPRLGWPERPRVAEDNEELALSFACRALEKKVNS
jgi:hypothetical protein